MEQKTKKVYPSELNTKAIACRIPYEDYSKIVAKCMQSQIKVSDWLLSLIYSDSNNSTINQKIAGTIEFPYRITFGELIDFTCNKDDDFYEETASKMRNTLNRLFSNGRGRNHYHRDSDVVFEFMNFEELQMSFMNCITQYLQVHDSWINSLGTPKTPKTPNLLDAKVQIQEIAKKKFSGKDFRTFIKDLNELLNELD